MKLCTQFRSEGLQYLFLKTKKGLEVGLLVLNKDDFSLNSIFCFKLWHRFVLNTHPWPESDELEDALKGEAHGEGEVHVGEQVPQDERSPVKLNTGKDKTRMKKGLKCVRNYCFSWAVDIDRKVIEFDKLTFGPISGSRLLDSWCKKAILPFSEDNFWKWGVLRDWETFVPILNFNSRVSGWQSINIRWERLNFWEDWKTSSFSQFEGLWGWLKQAQSCVFVVHPVENIVLISILYLFHFMKLLHFTLVRIVYMYIWWSKKQSDDYWIQFLDRTIHNVVKQDRDIHMMSAIKQRMKCHRIHASEAHQKWLQPHCSVDAMQKICRWCCSWMQGSRWGASLAQDAEDEKK